MPAVLVTVPTVTQNSLHHLSNSSITAHHLLDFMAQGKLTKKDALTICLDATQSGLSMIPSLSPTIFTLNALSVTTFPIYPVLGQAPNNAGLHTQWLGSYSVALAYKTKMLGKRDTKLCCKWSHLC